MAELFIQKPNGQTTRIDRHGVSTQTIEPLQIDWCDACDRWKPLSGGAYSSYLGLKTIWLCEACK